MKNSQFDLRAAGVLYLVATAASIAGMMLLPELSGYFNKQSVAVSVLFQLLNDAAVAGIGILLFRSLKTYHETVALTVLSTRIIEAVVLALGNIPLLLISPADSHHDHSYLASLAQQWGAWSLAWLCWL